MTGTKVEDTAFPTVPGASAAKNITTFEPTDKDELIWIWNVEVFSVHLSTGKLYVGSDAFGYWMAGVNNPETFPFVRFPPKESAAGAHELPKYFREVAGMEDYQSHSLQYAHLDAINNRITHFPVGSVSPPY